MTFALPTLEGAILAYFLTFARAGAMIMLLPAIGEVGVPPRVRLAFALAVSAALAPAVAHNYPLAEPNTLALGAAIAREITAGVLIGAMARLIMSALHVAGTIIGVQTGLAFAQTFDPGQGAQGAILGTFLTLIGTVLVFQTGLHHLAIDAIRGSYVLLPPDAAFPAGDMAELAVATVSSAFALGLQLSAPFIVFGLVVYATLGVLARLMPQLQVFFLAIPANILLGFFLLMMVIGVMMTVFLDYFAVEMAKFGG